MKTRTQRLLFDSHAFDDRDVSIQRQVSEGVHAPAGKGPADFEVVNFCLLSDAQYFAWIVRGQVTSSACLQPRTLQRARLPGDLRANRIGICLFSNQPESEP